MSVYQLGGLRVVDLTKPLDPAAESRRCHMYRFNTGGPIPDYHTIMDLTSHLGTHCECPYHHEDSWPDVAALPLTSFMGRCVYVELEGVAPNGYITPEVLDRALGGRIQAGDVVILDSPYKLPPFPSGGWTPARCGCTPSRAFPVFERAGTEDGACIRSPGIRWPSCE